jgi:tRNA-splicing endonuclease subunit Sen2
MTECWNEFRRAEPRFPALYTAYHFLRTRAWVSPFCLAFNAQAQPACSMAQVPKTGLKFGVDFVIYKLGPSYYHAQ